jgi:hypothetical protein
MSQTPEVDWIEALRERCHTLTQAAVVTQLQEASGTRFPSPTIISQVLNGKYPAEPTKLRALVEGLYCGAVVDCPVLGEIGRDRCEAAQSAPFSAANPQRVALYRACRGGCVNSRLGEQA